MSAGDELLRAIEAGDAAVLHRKLDEGLARVVNTPLRNGVYAVHVAAQRGDAPALQTLLLAGAHVNQESEEAGTHLGWTATHYAAHRDDATLLRVLVGCKADLHRRAADGWCALHVAAFKGSLAAMRVLLECGADVNCATNLAQTPLVFAVNYGRLDCVRLLLNAGADVTGRDVQGDSLLHHALHYQLSKLFEDAYEVPEAQLDTAVVLALAGAPVALRNADDKLATHYLRNTLPSLQSALELIATHARQLRGAGAATATATTTKHELNYLTLCTLTHDALVALGVPAAAATQLQTTLQQLDLERIALAQHVDKKTTKTTTAAAAETTTTTTTAAAAKAEAAATADEHSAGLPSSTRAATAALPAHHPPMSPEAALQALHAGDDPSGGQCPFFRRNAHKPAVQAAGGVQVGGGGDALCPFSVAFVQRHSTTLLCMGIAFVLGMWADQLVTRLAGLHV